MPDVNIHLFGKLVIEQDQQATTFDHVKKVIELFCFLLLYRERPHNREHIADLLWSESCSSEGEAKKYLRKTIWQLNRLLGGMPLLMEACSLRVDPEWIQLRFRQGVWIDILNFQDLYDTIATRPGADLTSDQFRCVQEAVDLYQGDLLEGCYQDWCLLERERYKDMYLALLEKLVSYCETHRDYEGGIRYSKRILAHDRAHEPTYLHLMMLYAQTGNRAAALRQFETCRAVLKEELGIQPGAEMLALQRRLVNDQSLTAFAATSPGDVSAELEKLQQLIDKQEAIQQEIRRQFTRLEKGFGGK